MRIALFTRSLNAGGTERQVVLLARGLKARGHDVTVMLFQSSGTALEREVAASGVALVPVGKSGRWDLLGFFLRLVRAARAVRPQALYAFLPTSNILAVLLRPFLPGARVVLGVRASDMDLSRYDWLSRLSYRVEGRLAPLADAAIANAERGRELAVARGFPAARIAVVPNGIDGDRFRPDAALRRSVRAGWSIPEGVTLIGVVARLDPMKGHRVFLAAAQRMLARRPDLRFVAVGGGSEREALVAETASLGLDGHVQFYSERPDIEAVMNALDLFVLPSVFGEGSSNALAEAAATGLRCVATDVGASRQILGEEGGIVPPGDSQALADACLAALDRADGPEDRARRRARVLAQQGIDALVARTLDVLAAS